MDCQLVAYPLSSRHWCRLRLAGQKALNEFIVQVEKCFDYVCSFCRTRNSPVIIVTVRTKWRAGEWGFDSQQGQGFVCGIWISPSGDSQSNAPAHRITVNYVRRREDYLQICNLTGSRPSAGPTGRQIKQNMKLSFYKYQGYECVEVELHARKSSRYGVELSIL